VLSRSAITVRDRDAGVAGLSLEDIPCPVTLENDVVVRVHAAGFTPGELEPPGSHHVLAENTSATQPAKLLVVFVSDTGDPLKADDPHS